MFPEYEDDIWLWKGFRKFMHIFEGTLQHEYYKELARKEVLQEYEQVYEEERQRHLRALRELLPMIAKARFPMLTRLAETQASLVKDVTTIAEVAGKVRAAQTIEEAENALLSCLPGDDSEK